MSTTFGHRAWRRILCIGGSTVLASALGVRHLVLASSEPRPPSFSFGVIADVQWADVPDGFNYDRTIRRCYRGALDQLKDAVHWWGAQQLHFIANLGDLIDGKNAQLGQSIGMG